MSPKNEVESYFTSPIENINKNALNHTAVIPANLAVYIIGTSNVVKVVLTKWEPALINLIAKLI